MDALDKIGIRHAPLSNRIVIARFGKDPTLALDKRDAQSEFFQALISYAFDGKMPVHGQAAEIQFGGGDEQFIMTVRRLGASAPADVALKTGNRDATPEWELMHDLIQQAKGYESEKGGPITDHLDAAENWLDEAEEMFNSLRAERTGEGWRPVEESDREIATIQQFGSVTLRNSHPAWVRDKDGRVYEAVWTIDDRGRGYWWDLEAESPADPVEIQPHPLTASRAALSKASPSEGGEV